MITGVKVTSCSRDELNEYICRVAREGRKEVIPNVNIHCLNIAWKNRWFREFLNSCKLVFCDGDGVRLAATLLGKLIEEKITYNRWIWNIAQVSATENLTWYLLGSREDVVARAAETLMRVVPDLKIVGFHSGYWESESGSAEVVARINRCSPHILVVGMGMPLQEAWLQKNLSDLRINVALTGGAVWEYVAGEAHTTPTLFYVLKLEWLFRMLQEPRRLWRRYLVGIPLFGYRMALFHVCKVRPAGTQ